MADQDKDQKTEEATPRKLDEARKEGQVAFSQELIAALSLCCGFAAMALAGGQVWHRVGEVLVKALNDLPQAGQRNVDVIQSAEWLRGTITSILGPIAIMVVPIILMMLVVGYGQVGFQIATKAVQFDPDKINPVKGFSRLFSLRSTVRTVLSGVKILAIGTVMATVAWHQVPGVITIGTSELGPLLVGLGVIAMRCTGAALVMILLLAAIDFLFQRWQFKRDQRMSKQEVKEEHKMSEGDPQLKGKVREVQRQMATRRMMDDVPKATVVVTNPTHYAVALRYEREESTGAPMVLAKGAGHVALRIKQIAAENEVICYEDVPLARALYAQAEVGEEIPTELFAAVAAVLAHVYKMRGQGTPEPAAA